MRTAIAICLLGAAFASGACNQGPTNAKAEPAKADNSKPAVNKAEEEAALRAADTAWSEAAGKKDVEAVTSFMSDDGSTLPPNEPVAKGKEAVKKGWTNLLALKDLDIKWQPTEVRVADSGELGYTNGTYTLSFTDPKAGKVSDKGKYLEVWKKADGKWKCYLDMYSSDNPVK